MTILLTRLLGNTNPVQAAAVNVRDSSGYEIFGHGPSGEAHVLVHRLTDTARWGIGHQVLGEWLSTRSAHGSDWVHLQFHMAMRQAGNAVPMSVHRQAA